MTALAQTQHDPIQIAPYDPVYHDEVVSLITSIQQQEFGLAVTLEEQFDLRDLPGTYQKAGGNFWLAFYHEKLIGTIGLIDLGDGIGVLKKMFVRAAYRGNEVGRKLLVTLIDHARAQGIIDLYLGTAEPLSAAHRFYERNGFAVVDDADIPPAVFPTLVKADTRRYHRRIV